MQFLQAVLFDFGNVLIKCSYDRVFSSWASKHPYNFEFFKENFPFDDQFLEYEKGNITSTQFFTHITTQMAISWSFDQFKEGWITNMSALAKNAIGVLQKLKRSELKVIGLTNTNELHADTWRRLFPEFVRCFDRIFCSHVLHAHKPDPEIFQKVLNSLQIPANQILFLDDMPENLLSAADLGFQTLLVEDPDSLEDNLKSLIS